MRILLCWELGAGSGHLEPMGAIASRLAGLGHDVTFASRDLGASARYPLTRRLAMVQAPVIWPFGQHRNAFSLADMLLKLRWGHPDELCAWLDAWQRLFELCGAELVITEHAPTAVLAARVAGLKAATQGNGFFVPPATSPLPGFTIGNAERGERLAEVEATAVDAVNRALARYGASPIDSLAGLYPAARSFLSTYPAFDHFGERPGATYYGTPAQEDVGEPPRWPDGRGEKIFVYMHPDYPQFPVMLEQLAALGHPTLVVAPGFDARRARLAQAPHLRVQESLVNLDTVARECRLVVCHASHGTAARVLRHGIAPILAPHFVEQALLAYRLARAGLVFAAHPDPARHDYATMIDAALRGEAQHECAQRFAADNPPEGAAARFATMVDAMLELA